MAYSVIGRLLDKDKQPIAFAMVYTSDANGKPLPNPKNAQTDENGRWKLDGVNDSDFITGRMVGYNQKSISAKSIKTIQNPMTLMPQRAINITLPDDVNAVIPEVQVTSTKITKKQKNTGKYVMISAIGLLAITGILLTLKNKKII
jgi:hypothetical protein